MVCGTVTLKRFVDEFVRDGASFVCVIVPCLRRSLRCLSVIIPWVYILPFPPNSPTKRRYLSPPKLNLASFPVPLSTGAERTCIVY